MEEAFGSAATQDIVVTGGCGKWAGPLRAGGHASLKGPLRLLACWLAVLAILVQTALPDLAMAMRGWAAGVSPAVAAAATDGKDPAAHAHHHHAHGHGEAPVADPAPASKGPIPHDHGAACPFCMALAAHALTPPPGFSHQSSASGVLSDPEPPGMDRISWHFEHTPLNPRAPPASDRT